MAAADDDRFEQHRNEAIRLLGMALDQDSSASGAPQRNLIAAAQVHAALAHAVALDSTRRAVVEAAPHRAAQTAIQTPLNEQVGVELQTAVMTDTCDVSAETWRTASEASGRADVDV